MLNYGFVNGNVLTSYISDDTFAFRGTWSSGGTYSAPLDVVDYNNGKFICLFTNTGQPPIGSASWSELVLVGTVQPTDPFAIADTALTTAEAASVLSLAAAGTAAVALNIALSGSSVAQAAYQIASNGTSVGTRIPIASGTNVITVTGANFGYIPSTVVATVEAPSLSAQNLWPTLIGQPTSTGFTIRLNGTTDSGNYFLHWMARR